MKIKNLKLKITKERLASLLFYLLVFLWLLYPYRDYDWGWHFRYGEYFITTGKILAQDPFSWTMQGYRWVNHSWLFDPILYVLTRSVGFYGLSVAGAVVGFAIFLVSTLPFKLKLWQKAILAYFYIQLTSGVFWQGLRSQMISGLMFSIFMFFLIKLHLDPHFEGSRFSLKTIFKKGFYSYCAIFFILFLLWVNLHGSFVFGIVILGIFAFSQLFQKSGNIKKAFDIRLTQKFIVYCLLFIIAIAASLLSPWTYEVYLEAIRHSSSPLLKYILEWDSVPVNSSFFLLFLVYTVLFCAVMAVRKRVTDLPFLLTFIASAYLALSARRYMALFVIVNLPFLALALQSFKFDLNRFKATLYILVIVIIVAFEIVFFRNLPNYHLYKGWNYSMTDYCQLGSGCSEKIAHYLIKNPPKGGGFNFYDIGGSLIGQGVPAKLFIDGRMHLWENPDHYQVFLEYQKMYYGGDFARFNKYNFDWILVQKDSIPFQVIVQSNKLGKWKVVIEDGNLVYAVRKR